MSIWKKKHSSQDTEEEDIKAFLEDCERHREWMNDPNRSYKNYPLYSRISEDERMIRDAYRKKLERRIEKTQAIVSTIRSIILTPLAPVFGMLSLIAKILMYGGAFTFLYACYRIYECMRIGEGFMTGIRTEWKFMALPFIASFLYYIFSVFADYCSDHSFF